MYRFSMFIRPSPPGIIPESSKAGLLFKADNLWDDLSLPLELGKPAEDRQARRTSTDYAYFANHTQSKNIIIVFKTNS